MATRLEPGQVQLRSSGGVPMQQIVPTGVDYVAPRVESRTLDTMANILDRMSTSAFGAAKEMRQREAIQFAAENEITPEQLQLAKEGIPQAIPGLGSISGDFTAYGQALKKARTLQLAGHFEIEGRNELTKLLTEVQSGRISSKDVAAKIATMTEGYAKSLAQVDGEASIKFRATMATHGNTVLSSAYESELKRVKDQERIKFDLDFDNGIRLLEETVSQKPEMIDQIADVFRTNVANQALLLGDLGLQKEYSTKFETALRNAKIGAVTRHILTNDVLIADPQLRKKIMTAQLDKMSPVMLRLLQTDMSAVAQINANVDIALNRRESENKDKQAEQKLNATKSVTTLATEGFGLPETNTKRRKEIGEALAEIRRSHPDIVPLDLIKEMVEPVEKKEGNSQVEFNVRKMIFEGKITTADQIWAYTSKGLSIKQSISALNLLYREDKQDQSKLERGIADRSNIPTKPGSVVNLDPKGTEFERSQRLKEQADQIKERYRREGKLPPTPEQILQEIDKNIASQRDTEKAKAARKQLDEIWSKQPWINGPINRSNLPALKEKAKKENKMREFDQIEKLLNQAEGQ